MHRHRLNQSLRTTTSCLKRWNISTFGFVDVKIRDLEMELENLQVYDVDGNQQWHIRDDLKEQRVQMESIYKQKSKELWLKERDCNTKFFHTNTLVQ